MKQTELTPSGAVLIDPAIIHYDAARNYRYGLKQDRIKSVAASIVEVGRVIENLEVELLPEPINGKPYILNIGAYRLAAVTMLNKDGAGIRVPATIVPAGTGLERLRTQIAENTEREDNTPMDLSNACKRLIDEGVSKPEIRKSLKRPGRKEMSNSWLNSLLEMQNLPKPIQKKIHEGLIDITGAVELTKCAADKRELVVARIEKERAALIDKEEKDEQKYLDSLKKAQDAQAKAEEVEKERLAAEEAKLQKVKDAENARVAAAEKLAAAGAKVASNPEAAKEVAEAAKEVQKADETLKRLTEKAKKAVADAKSKADESKQAKDARGNVGTGPGSKKLTKDTKIGGSAVKSAAKKEGATKNTVPLNRKEIMDCVRDWKAPSGNGKAGEVIQAMATILESCFDGISTPDGAFKELKKIFGGK